MSQQGTQGMTFEQMCESGMRIAEGICGIVTAPIDTALRPHHSTRFLNPFQLLLACCMMLLLPLAGRASSYLPMDDAGLFGLGTLSLLFFAGQVIHGPRLLRRMLRMELEDHSEFEGEALPFFRLLPFGSRFWIVRIFWEPIFVAVGAVQLKFLGLLDLPATLFLIVSAAMLAFKNYLGWYQSWLQLRLLMDARHIGPLLARAAAGKAPEDELAKVHMAGFQGSVPAEVRTAAIAQMAPRTPSLPPEIARLLSPVEPVAPRVA